jgi:hypothetical protein
VNTTQALETGSERIRAPERIASRGTRRARHSPSSESSAKRIVATKMCSGAGEKYKRNRRVCAGRRSWRDELRIDGGRKLAYDSAHK